MGCKLYANEVRTLPVFKLLSMFFKAPWIRKTFLKQSYFVYRKFWKLSYSQIFCTKLHAVVQLESLLSACNDSNKTVRVMKTKLLPYWTAPRYSLVCYSCFWQLNVSDGIDQFSLTGLPLNSNFFFFVLVSTSGANNNKRACEDSHWNNRTTFVFHKIVNYNPWTWKQSEDSLQILFTPKRSEFTGVQKLFLSCLKTRDKIDHYISCRAFFLCVKQQNVAGTDEITGKYENQTTPKQIILLPIFS